MATFAELKEVRLRISDPYLFIDILSVAASANLPIAPAAPASQTVYKTISTGAYYAPSIDAPAVAPDDYTIQELRISDSRIEGWIDSGGVNYATCRALKQIVAQLGVELGGIKKTSTGAEDTEFQDILSLYNYYKGLLADCKEDAKEEAGNSTGRIGKMTAPTIAGGNL
jgi:hypothetical protein